ncbi:hypothetical protein D5S17_09455 [Pseudonocardiaceae bacterium YIM PH 21723]|nr:hypothetical protein D5S17_09455 [Pseudonocardiaceae bacterium YIM PH 21723]
MTFYQLEPEVPGQWGANTQLDTSTHPPVVQRLHLELDCWLGDDLITSFPAYLVTPSAAERLGEASLTGFELRDAEINQSEQSIEVDGPEEIPAFRWLHITGQAAQDDFGIGAGNELVVSQTALEILRAGTLANCEVTEYSGSEAV